MHTSVALVFRHPSVSFPRRHLDTYIVSALMIPTSWCLYTYPQEDVNMYVENHTLSLIRILHTHSARSLSTLTSLTCTCIDAGTLAHTRLSTRTQPGHITQATNFNKTNQYKLGHIPTMQLFLTVIIIPVPMRTYACTKNQTNLSGDTHELNVGFTARGVGMFPHRYKYMYVCTRLCTLTFTHYQKIPKTHVSNMNMNIFQNIYSN